MQPTELSNLLGVSVDLGTLECVVEWWLLKTGVNQHLAIRGTDGPLCPQLRSWGCRPAQADLPGYLIT